MDRRGASLVACRSGMGNNCQWFSHTKLGQRHRLRGHSYTRGHAFASDAYISQQLSRVVTAASRNAAALLAPSNIDDAISILDYLYCCNPGMAARIGLGNPPMLGSVSIHLRVAALSPTDQFS